MADVLSVVGIFVGLVILAVVLLVTRDARRHRRHRQQEERRPAAERIARIHDDASFMIEQLKGILERPQALERPDAVVWIPPVLEYYRRLEALASDAEASTEEVIRLAEAASAYVREHRIKGISVGEQAWKLAKLLRARNAD